MYEDEGIGNSQLIILLSTYWLNKYWISGIKWQPMTKRSLQSLIFPRTKEKSFPIILASLGSMIPEHRKSRTFCDSRRKIIYCVRNIRQSNYSGVIGHRGRWGLWSIRCRFLSSGNCLRHLKANDYRKPKVWTTAWKKKAQAWRWGMPIPILSATFDQPSCHKQVNKASPAFSSRMKYNRNLSQSAPLIKI